MARLISYGHQWIDKDDIAAVVAALKSDFLTQGPLIAEFEQGLADYCGVRYAVAVCNGTAALHLAVASLRLPAGSEGITSPNTFVASANALIYCGVVPRFTDIDRRTFLIDPCELTKKIGRQTAVVIPVHFAGQPADMATIAKIARERDIYVIEDAAHAIGGCYPSGSRVGSCEYSDLTIFSFHPVKNMTTAEGGAITTNQPELYRRLLSLRSHGITRDPGLMTEQPGPWYYEMQELGFNYRITELQAALGMSQLKKLPFFVERRRQLVDRYNMALSRLTWLEVPYERPGVYSAWHLYVVQIDFGYLGRTRADLMNDLRKAGIGTQVLYIPVHLQPYYRERYGHRRGNYPVCEAYYECALALPLFPAMTEEDQDRVITELVKLN